MVLPNRSQLLPDFVTPCFVYKLRLIVVQQQQHLRGLSPRANYTDRATAACRRSYCQLLPIEGVVWSARRIPTAVLIVVHLI
jgi:hypothetical protein